MNLKTAAIACVVSFATVSTANAGLLDFLFGKRAPTPVAQPAPHPQVTIAKPRPKRVARSEKPRKPRETRLIVLNPKDQLARTIDPVAHPDWYLIDPTLKRGDILVLADRVLVFRGGEIGAAKSYASLEETRLYNRRDRLLIAEMTRQPAQPFLVAEKAAPGGSGQLRVLRSASVLKPLGLRAGL